MVIRRAAKLMGGLSLGVVLFGMLLLAGTLLPGIRDRAARRALRTLDHKLPGTLRVDTVHWSLPLRFRLEGLDWGEDTQFLAGADRLEFDIGLSALVRREINLRSLIVENGRLDPEAIAARFPKRNDERAPRGSSVLRAGSLPGVPSIGIDEAHVRIEFSGSRRGIVDVQGAAELRTGRAPQLSMSRLDIELVDPELTLHAQDWEVALDDRPWTGELDGSWGEDWPFVVRVESDARARRLVLLPAEEGSRMGRADAGRLLVQWIPEESVPRRGTFHIDLLTPHPADWERLPGVGRDLPHLPFQDALRLRADGEADFGETLHAAFSAHVESKAPGLDIQASARIDGATIEVSRWALVSPGIEFAGRLRVEGDDHTFSAAGSIHGASSLAQWFGEAATAGLVALQTEIQLTSHGSLRTPRLELAVRGEGSSPSVRVAGLSLQASGPWSSEGFVDVDLRFEIHGSKDGPALGVAQRLRLRPEGDLIAAELGRLSVRRLRAPLSPLSPGAPDERAALRLDPVEKTLLVKKWPVRLESDGVGIQAILRADLSLDTGAPRGRVGATIDLGAWTQWEPFLPSTLVVEDLEPVRLRLDAEGGGGRWRARLDPSDTPWIEGKALRAQWNSASASIDSLRWRVFGVRLEGGGNWQDGRLQARAGVVVEDSTLLLRRIEDLPPASSLRARVALQARGRADSLEILVEGMGNWKDAERSLTRWEASARRDSTGEISGRVSIPRGAVIGTTRLDQMWLEFLMPARGGTHDVSGIGSPARPTWIALRANGPRWSVSEVARLHQLDDEWIVRTDTLALDYDGHSLLSEDPFEIRYRTPTRALTIRGLRLSGNLGIVEAEGTWAPEGMVGQASMRVALPPPAAGALWAHPRPDSLVLEIRPGEKGTVEWNALATGLRLGDPRDLRIEAGGIVGPRTALRLRLIDPGGSVSVRGNVEWIPAHQDSRWPSADDSLRGSLSISGLALPAHAASVPVLLDAYSRGQQSTEGRMSAELEVGGLARAPTVEIESHVDFEPRSPLAQDGLGVSGRWSHSGEFEAALSWSRRGNELMSAWSHGRFDPSIPDSARVRGRMHADDFALSILDTWLPPRSSVRGFATGDLDLRWSERSMQWDGELEVRDLEVRTADGSRARAEGSLRFDTVDREARVRGEVRVVQAQLKIPETQKTFAPKEGTALLWQYGWNQAEETPHGWEEGALPPARLAGEKPLPWPMRVDITIDLERGVQIRSDRLDLEVGGVLNVALDNQLPVVEGALAARSGSLRLLGQPLRLERGEVRFYGGAQLDPELDIVVGTRRGDTRVSAIVQGRARRPQLQLESDPALPEADILSLLLFGEPTTGLDGRQTELLRSELTRTLQGLALPALEREVASALELDVLHLRSGGPESPGQSLVAGKYLGPRALLSYEQDLQENGAFRLHLRYWVARDLTLESRVGRVEPSNFRLNWSRDY